MQNVLDILKQDHAKVRELLDRLAATTTRAAKTRPELLERIATELQVHTTLEEEIFYPAIREAATTNEQRELVAEAFEEHRAVEKLVMPDLEKTEVDSVEFGGRAKVLKELVEHHADEEEEELFPLAKELLSEQQLRDLGQRTTQRKQELLRKHRAA
jgi:hemerythrin-like domain-containing protein